MSENEFTYPKCGSHHCWREIVEWPRDHPANRVASSDNPQDEEIRHTSNGHI